MKGDGFIPLKIDNNVVIVSIFNEVSLASLYPRLLDNLASRLITPKDFIWLFFAPGV